MTSSSKQQNSRTAIDRFAMVIATALGAGYSPVAPGTAGSLLSVVLWWALFRWSPFLLRIPEHIALIVVLTVVGVWASTKSEVWFGKIDPHETVIDEVVGQQITYIGLAALNWKSLVLGFLLFRLFDVWKPFPIRKIQDWKGGMGIVMDDVAAGIYAWVILFLVRTFFHWAN